MAESRAATYKLTGRPAGGSEWDQFKHEAGALAGRVIRRVTGRVRMEPTPPRMNHGEPFKHLQPNSRFSQGSPVDVLNQGVAIGKEAATVGQKLAVDAGSFVQEHQAELANAGRAGMVGLAVMGTADKLAGSIANATPENPAHVRTEIHPGLKEYSTANPLPVTSYAPEAPRAVANPLDTDALPQGVSDVPLPVFTSQRPDTSQAAAISESITAQEQHTVASELPSTTPPDSRSDRSVDKVNSDDLAKEKAEVVTGAEKYLASQQVGSESAQGTSLNSVAQLQADQVTGAEQVLAGTPSEIVEDSQVTPPVQGAVVETPPAQPMEPAAIEARTAHNIDSGVTRIFPGSEADTQVQDQVSKFLSKYNEGTETYAPRFKTELRGRIEKRAVEVGIPVIQAMTTAFAESNFDDGAIGASGETTAFQVMPGLGKDGPQYLAELNKMFAQYPGLGDYAYNLGPGSMQKAIDILRSEGKVNINAFDVSKRLATDEQFAKDVLPYVKNQETLQVKIDYPYKLAAAQAFVEANR